MTDNADDVIEIIPPEKVEIVSPPSQIPTAREAALPVAGAALLWMGRAILPRLLEQSLNFLARLGQPSVLSSENRVARKDDLPRSAAPRAGRERAGRRQRRRARQGRRNGR